MGGSREGSAGDGSATAAAAGEQEDDEDDPDPVVVVEDVAQTVVHSVPPKDEVVDSGDPVSTIIVCRMGENVRGIFDFSSDQPDGKPCDREKIFGKPIDKNT